MKNELKYNLLCLSIIIHTMFHRNTHLTEGKVRLEHFFVSSDWFSFCSSFLILKISGICQTKRKKSIGNCCFLWLQIDSDGTEDSARVVVGCGAGDGGGGRCSCRGGGDSGR
jgi:hypothetical protein